MTGHDIYILFIWPTIVAAAAAVGGIWFSRKI